VPEEVTGMGKTQCVAVLLACIGALSACRIRRAGAGAMSFEDDPGDAGRSAAAGSAQHTEPAKNTMDSSARGSLADPSSKPPDASAIDAGVDTVAPDSDAGFAPNPTRDAGATPATADAVSCGSAQDIKVCNPIRNTGCAEALGMQCDVDLLAATLSGQCVFSAPAPDGSACLNIPPTETCPAGHTCVNLSECKKLCTCDSDCDAGDCCTERLGESGWKTCAHC
jgi:hypothetical protein